MLINETRLSAS